MFHHEIIVETRQINMEQLRITIINHHSSLFENIKAATNHNYVLVIGYYCHYSHSHHSTWHGAEWTGSMYSLQKTLLT